MYDWLKLEVNEIDWDALDDSMHKQTYQMQLAITKMQYQ